MPLQSKSLGFGSFSNSSISSSPSISRAGGAQHDDGYQSIDVGVDVPPLLDRQTEALSPAEMSMATWGWVSCVLRAVASFPPEAVVVHVQAVAADSPLI